MNSDGISNILRIKLDLSKTFISVKVSWTPSQYPKRRLFVRSRKFSKPRDWYFKLPYRFAIWQAHRQHCCRSTCQISERSDNFKYKSRSFQTLRDLTERRLFGYWDGALKFMGKIGQSTTKQKENKSRIQCLEYAVHKPVMNDDLLCKPH